jgi:hypothetical protein
LEEILNSYQNGNEVSLVETEKLFKTVKQSPTLFMVLITYACPILFRLNLTSDGYYTETKPANSFQLD